MGKAKGKGKAKATPKATRTSETAATRIDDLGPDLLLNILSRLPALAFSSAACVSQSWKAICNDILSVPKFASAVSFNPSLQDAVGEVVGKVLSEPIRPHFVLASISPSTYLKTALELINAKFGSRVPTIVTVSEGIIGQDVRTNKFVQAQWEAIEEEDDGPLWPEGSVAPAGIILTVGYLPGLNTCVLPLLYDDMVGLRDANFDEFVMDIKKHTSTISSSDSPAGIILFSRQKLEINPLLQKFEFAFPKETFVMGDGGCEFSCKNNIESTARLPMCAAVALIFARNRRRPVGVGETQFHVMLSTGLSPVGAMYKAVSVKPRRAQTWLTASRETDHVQLDGHAILDQIYEELGDPIHYPIYIGVRKNRRCSVGKEIVRRFQFQEFHYVTEGDDEYLYVDSIGIQTGDLFRCYVPDLKIALSSVEKVSKDLKHLKLDCDHENNHASQDVRHHGKHVFGGMIFSCCGRDASFYNQRGIDSAPFLNNFPGVPFGGTYCGGEIARSSLSLYNQDDDGSHLVHCNRHVFSVVYLVLSYSLPTNVRGV